ncbi:retrovirus-related pol polyprotein from transposon TNT 1-94 [Tanacetum coccineum]
MFRVDRIKVRGTTHGVQVQLVIGELRTELGMQIQVKQDVDEQPVQDLALSVDNVFQADECDAFDSDVDERHRLCTHDNDHYQDAVCDHHEVHKMYDDVQPNYVVDSHADYTSDSNMIPYDQYVKDNAMPVVQSNVSSVPNDAYMMILNDMHEQPAQYASVTTQNNVVDKSLTAELATYKEQVELYERRAKFELTKREQKIDEQLRIDLIKNEAEALKEQTTALKPIKALTVYPLNTPATFVPKMTTTVVQARYLELEAELSKLCDKGQKDDHTELVKCFSNLEITQLTEKVTVLQEQNELFRAENAKIKQHYKELYDSIKITHAKHIEQTTALLTENENLKAQIHENMKCITMDSVKPRVLAPGRYDIDVEPIPPHNRNNKEVHLDYLKHLKESVETLHVIVEEAKVERPLYRSIASACLYTKHSQKLLEYVIGTCPKDFNKQDKKHASTPLTRKKVYYVEGLGHNLFSVGQFCDSDLEVAFRKHSCYVRDTDGVELIKGSRGSNLYTISVEDMMKSSPICLLSKASKNKSWLWHRRLNHLNFGTINDLARKDLVRGLPILKFKKDHLCFACQLGKSKKHTHTPKTENTNLEVLNTLHMDLCRPIRVQTINGNKYILVIVDDYSSFTWVKFLRSKYETPEFFIKFLKQIQVGLNKTVRYIHTDNGTEFINQELPSKMALSKDGTVLLLRLLGQC